MNTFFGNKNKKCSKCPQRQGTVLFVGDFDQPDGPLGEPWQSDPELEVDTEQVHIANSDQILHARANGAYIGAGGGGSLIFTASMRKEAGVVFDGAPVIQGKFDNLDPDVIAFSRGSQVADYFYDNFDSHQGTMIALFKPEWSEGDHAYAKYVLDTGSGSNVYFIIYNDRIGLTVGGQSFTANHSFVAGTTVQIAVSWDTVNKLDGTNYGRITIDGSHSYGITVQPTTAAPVSTLYLA